MILYPIIYVLKSFIILVEHCLSILAGIHHSYVCSLTSLVEYNILEGYIKENMPQLFHVFSGYSIFTAIGVMSFNFYCTFIWNFLDLFITTLSVGLSRKFNQLYCNLYRNKHNKCSELYWQFHRQCYQELVDLLRYVDSAISNLVLLSFFNNLFFICIQLFNSLR